MALTLDGTNGIYGVSSIGEVTTISPTAATGTINYYAQAQSVLYYTLNATGNWTLNITGNASLSLNAFMNSGDTRTITFLVSQGAAAYYQTALTIDGVSVTPKWQGGTTPVSGNANSIDAYTFAILKISSGSYVVLASQYKFA
tara:strand:- start:1772 stop:2200 length:429 start_codon:yes stop_codon:yes gene_type:complete